MLFHLYTQVYAIFVLQQYYIVFMYKCTCVYCVLIVPIFTQCFVNCVVLFIDFDCYVIHQFTIIAIVLISQVSDEDWTVM